MFVAGEPTYDLPSPGLFVHVSKIQHPLLRSFIDVDFDVYRDDVDWVVANWQAIFILDFEIYKEMGSRI